jgi:hypothetical protein
MTDFPWNDAPSTNRVPRDLETREHDVRQWQESSSLPDPRPQDGWDFRWIRAEMVNNADDSNFSKKRREGWEPVRAEDHPELMLEVDPERNRHAARGNVEFGGLVLCKMPTEMVEQRKRFYEQKAQSQVDGVNANFLGERDGRSNMRTQELEFRNRPGDRIEGRAFHGTQRG